MYPISLYQYDNRGKLRIWSIAADENVISIEHGLADGVRQIKQEHVRDGLGGRTLDEQVASRVRSRINKQYDRGYKDSPEEAKALKGTNALGMFKPMLAQPLNKVKDIDYSHAFVQHKYDGHRCLITKINGQVLAYSRQGKLIRSIDHILDSLYIPEGRTVDGELYCHGVSLQKIGSWIKREQEASKNLMYHAYDIVANVTFEDRINELHNMCKDPTRAMVVPTMPVHSYDEVQEHFIDSRQRGYEGSIIRWGESGYETGKRSKGLVKVKATHDAEAKVIGVIPSKDGWGILECETPVGVYFKMPAPGSMDEKYRVLINRELYIGKHITYEYANLTADGVPFHPNALRFREDI